MVPCVCYGFVALTVFGCWLLFGWVVWWLRALLLLIVLLLAGDSLLICSV